MIGAFINVEENGGGDMKKDAEKLEGSSEGGNQEAGKVGERKGSKKAGEIEVVKSGQSQKNSRRAEVGQNEVETAVKKSNAKVRTIQNVASPTSHLSPLKSLHQVCITDIIFVKVKTPVKKSSAKSEKEKTIQSVVRPTSHLSPLKKPTSVQVSVHNRYSIIM